MPISTIGGGDIILFSLLLSLAEGIAGQSSSISVLLSAAWELFGALAMGALLAVPMAYLTGQISRGEPTQAEALGFVLLCAGIALWAEASYILACMTLGALVSSFAARHRRPFQAIEGIEWPYLILFFLLAGAALHLDALTAVGLIGAIYILARTAGVYLGTQIGGRISGAPPRIDHWIGVAVLPQAGVALGLALVAAQTFPALEDLILPTVLGTTVVFEQIGPVAARFALRRSGAPARQAPKRRLAFSIGDPIIPITYGETYDGIINPGQTSVVLRSVG